MSDTIIRMQLSKLRESPTNPRRRFSDADLQELADSIAVHDVMSPIVVRPLGQVDIEHTHEIVFGHRRFRAAARAGLADIPVIVREMTDQEAAVAQIHENLHRSDVHPIEEADAFHALMQDHGLSVEQIVADSGKSRSYVYGRLKLARIIPVVREACLQEDLGAEIALLIARLPHAKLQTKALSEVRGYDGWISYRDAKSRLTKFTIKLDTAPFDQADASLPGGACATCPKLACNDPDLHELDADVCTDRECHDAKLVHQAAKVVALARETGRPVIDGDAAQQIAQHPSWPLNGFERLRRVAFNRTLPSGELVGVTWEQALAELPADRRDEFRPTLIVIPGHESTPIDALPDELLPALLELLGEGDASEGASTPSTAAHARGGVADVTATWSPAERVTVEVQAWKRVRRAVLERLRAMPRTVEELRAMALRELDVTDDFDLAGEVMGMAPPDDVADEDAWCRGRIAEAGADDLAALLVAIAIDEQLGYANGSYGPDAQARAAERVRLAERYGVDVLAAAEEEQTDEAGSAGESQAVEAGSAGQRTATGDLFAEESSE